MSHEPVLQVEGDGSLVLDGHPIELEALEQKLERDRTDGETAVIHLVGQPGSSWQDVEKPLKLLQNYHRIAKGAVSG